MADIIIYDGQCNLCCGAAKFVRKHDRKERFSFVPRDSETGENLLKLSALPEKDRNTLIYYSSDQFFIRSSAVLHIFKDMGSAWKLFYGFIIIPVFIRDFLYILVARTRYYIFGKRGGCYIPAE